MKKQIKIILLTAIILFLADDVFEVVSLLTTEEIKNEWGEVLKNEYVYLQYIAAERKDLSHEGLGADQRRRLIRKTAK